MRTWPMNDDRASLGLLVIAAVIAVLYGAGL
jgi:hypothetical protein